jgi:hypothetical protein
MKSLHNTIATVAKTTAANCKSRVIEQQLFHVGESENAVCIVYRENTCT